MQKKLISHGRSLEVIFFKVIISILTLLLADLAFSASTKSEDPSALTVTAILSDKEIETTEVGKAQYVWLVDADDGFSGKCVSLDKDKKTGVFKVENKTFWLDANVKKRGKKVAVYKKGEVKRKKEEAEKKRRELAEKRQKEVDAKRKKLELERKKKELEVLKKKQEADKKRAELAEQRRQKLLDMKKKQEESDKKRRELAEKRKAEEDKKKEEERKKRDAILAQKKKEALEEKKRLVDLERKKKQEEEKRNEAIKKLQDEEAKKLADEEKRLREEEARLRGEALPSSDTPKKKEDKKSKGSYNDDFRQMDDNNFKNNNNNSSTNKPKEPPKTTVAAVPPKPVEVTPKKEVVETAPPEPKEVVSEVESEAPDTTEETHHRDSFETGLNLTDLNITRLLSLGLYFGYRISGKDSVQFFAIQGTSPALQSLSLQSSMYALRYLHFWTKKVYTNTGLGLQTIQTERDSDLSDEPTEVKTTDLVLDAALGTELEWRPFGALTMRVDWIGLNLRLKEMSEVHSKEKAGDANYNDKLAGHRDDHENLQRMQAYFLRIQAGITF